VVSRGAGLYPRLSRLSLKILGWRAAILHSDSLAADRWKWLKRHLQAGSLRTLDAGCGSGAFAIYAAKLGNESLGLSYDERNNLVAAERARLLALPNAHFSFIDLRKLDQHANALGAFDQIICCEVIEHILNDRKLVADLVSMLKPGGRLLLTTPYKHGKPIPGDLISEVEDGGHVRAGYTKDELRQLFNDCGLETVNEEYVSGYISQKLIRLDHRLQSLNLFAWLVIFPLRFLKFFDAPLTKLLKYPFFSVAVVGVKGSARNESQRSQGCEFLTDKHGAATNSSAFGETAA
jgi:SAM-dependent methyltransferase